MGNDDNFFQIDDVTFDLEEWDNTKFYNIDIADADVIDLKDIVVEDQYYPTDLYSSVRNVEQTLTEQYLRNKHPDLEAAYDAYQTLLKKYIFWNDVNKKG